ncbi:hypothetical protein [Clostridium botulinum]|uniref:hypothetical protein n=2 Tax=Clostridium botulinum TaxID=1491 RepID=UPI000774CC39|nr:hypothetical protein [Clostridium botulinum]
MGVFIKRTGGLNNISKLKSHLKYIGFRSREHKDDEKGFFGKDDNYYQYNEFIDKIQNDKALKHPKAVKAHKLVFSLKGVDYKAYSNSEKDYKDLIRATLKEYEDKKGVKLDWIASIHNAEGHPHVHVVIKATSQKDKEGKSKRIFFKKEDYREMKNIFNKEFEREAEYKGFSHIDQKEFDKTLNDIGKAFEAVTRSIEREIDKEEYLREISKDKEIKKEIKNIEKNKVQERER